MIEKLGVSSLQKVSEIVTMSDLLKVYNREDGLHISRLYDYVTGGAYKGQVHLFCAPSGIGKTRMGVHVACELLKQGWSVAYCTFEQTVEEIYLMCCQHFNEFVELGYEEIADKYLLVKRFDICTTEAMTNCINSLTEYDTVVWDYVTAPETNSLEAYGASAAAMQVMRALKHSAEVNDQFVFALAQSRATTSTEFSSSANIYLSSQLYNSVDVCAICKRVDNQVQWVDFVKVRYPFRGIGRCRVERAFDYAHCKVIDDYNIVSEQGDKYDVGRFDTVQTR